MSSNFGLPLFYSNSRQGDAARDEPRHSSDNANFKSFTPSGCGNAWAVNGAAYAPGLIPRGNFGNSPEGGCGIDTQTGTAKVKGPKQVFPRPFATTPFLGLGSVESIPDQNKVVFGHSTANRKSIQTVTDKQFPVFWPLIQEKKDDMVNDNYFIEPWIRGGLAVRPLHSERVDLTK